MSQRKKGTLLTYAYILISNTISFIYTPYMLRMMGQSEYGLYGTASSIVSYLSMLNFGVGGAYIRFNSRYRAVNDKEGEDRLNGMFLMIFSILALLVLFLGIGFVLFAGRLVKKTFTSDELNKLRIIMILLILNMMVTFLFTVVLIALESYEKYVFLRCVSLIAAIITPIINIVVLNTGGKAIAITATSLLISIMCYFTYYIYARQSIRMRFVFKECEMTVLKELFAFSGFLFLNTITDQITFSTDTIILSSLKGTTAVAIYNVGANFKNYFLQFSSAVSGVFGPLINDMVAQKKNITTLDEIFIKVGRVQFYIVSLVIIGYLAIGKAFVKMWAGADYTDAYYIGLLLMLAVFVPAIQNIGLEIQKALNKHKVRSIVYFAIALVNIGLTIPLSKMWSGIGAAFATMISMFVGRVIFMNIYYAKYIGLNIRRFWNSIMKITPGLIIPCIVGGMIKHYWDFTSLLEIIQSIIIISGVYFASIYLFSMNQYEKLLVKSGINHVLSKKKV